MNLPRLFGANQTLNQLVETLGFGIDARFATDTNSPSRFSRHARSAVISDVVIVPESEQLPV